MAWSAVDGQAVDGTFTVCGGRQAVGAGGLDPGVAHQLRDQHQIVPVTHQSGAKGVAQYMAGELGLEPGLLGDRCKDVTCPACGEALAKAVEQQGGIGTGAGPVGSLVIDPQLQLAAQASMNWDLPVVPGGGCVLSEADPALCGCR